MNIKTRFSVIIPARLAASRLPEKLLQTIGDKTVLEHSYLAAKQSQATRVVIAADDEKIINTAKAFAAEAILTDKNHQSGTDRLAEAVSRLNLSDDEIVVNLQGDEPFMPPQWIDLCAATLAHTTSASVATLAARITDHADIDNPNAVKVVINQRGQALYFSRAGIPFNRDNVGVNTAANYFHHLGIYAYRSGFLQRYQQLSPSRLESLEKLEQLRILDNGENIAVAVVDEKPPKGIDTKADLQAARQFYQKNQ